MLRKHVIQPVVAGTLVVSVSLAFGMGSAPKPDEEAANARIQPIAKINIVSAQKTAAGARSGEEIYKAVCSACHDSGAANAPKLGDKAAWAPRIGVGLDVLVKTATVGKGAMPPKGGSDANELELARAVAYMANKSGANFKEPSGGKIAGNERTGKDIVNAACLKCHETGEKGAPKLSDQAQWTQRVSKGIDAVTKTVIRGHGKMPARGGLTDVSDAELKLAVTELFRMVGSDIK
jgi:cytochrome c5